MSGVNCLTVVPGLPINDKEYCGIKTWQSCLPTLGRGMINIKTLLRACLALLTLPSWAVSHAANLAEGTEINAGNLEASLQARFEDHLIADLIPPSIQLLIRDLP